MPGTFRARYELQQIAVSANQKVRGNPHTFKAREVGMFERIKPVGKQALDRIAAKSAWGQTDVVYNQQFDDCLSGPRIAIG